jgi:hypothetical protein
LAVADGLDAELASVALSLWRSDAVESLNADVSDGKPIVETAPPLQEPCEHQPKPHGDLIPASFGGHADCSQQVGTVAI